MIIKNTGEDKIRISRRLVYRKIALYPSPEPTAFLFNLGGSMRATSVQYYHKTGYKPHVSEKVFCKDCQEYRDRTEIANKINEIFHTEGEWDFSTCFKACVKHTRGW